jgi:colicin import membrane protein
MNKNIRVPGAFRRDLNGDGRIPLFLPLAVSLICHIVFLMLVVFAPSLRIETPPAQSVINVSMVSLKTTASPTTATPAAERRTPKTEKTPAVEQPPVKTPEKTVRKPAEKAAKPTPTPKTSLKKKTFKSTEVVKHAIRQLEEKKKAPAAGQKEQASSPEMLKSALERLRQEVGKAESAKLAAPGNAPAGEGGNAGGKLGKFNEDGKRKAELIDLYRLEVAFQIQKQWAFNEQLAGGDKSLVAAIVFKVMPDGEIRDIFFTDRSGNTYLDESAYKAIVKSNPVDSHPKGLNQPYVEMGIRFTPQGIR